MPDDIQRRLDELESARLDMQAQLEKTMGALDGITQKIDELKARQEARMRSDERIDNTVVDKVVHTGSTKEKAARQLDEQALKRSSSPPSAKLIFTGLTEDDVNVQPSKSSDSESSS